MESNAKVVNKQIKTTTNPHLKRIKNVTKDQEEVTKNEEEHVKSEVKIISSINKSKESIAKDLIKGGYINSFIDFFYLGWRKTPNMKSKFSQILDESEKQQDELNQNSQNDIDPNQENLEEKSQDEEDTNKIQRHIYDIQVLDKFSQILVHAEECIRKSFKEDDVSYNEEAIKYYVEISHTTVSDRGTPIEAIYFNEKCINIAKKYNLIKPLINSYIDMGNCFEKNSGSNDMNISKCLKEKAKEIFTQNLQGKDDALENYIYVKLISLYKQLAGDQEQTKNYPKAIELLNKLLEVLDSLMKITGDGDSDSNKDWENIKTESNLNIANLYYKMEKYQDTLDVLNKIPELRQETDKLTNYQVQGLYRYAETYEMLGDIEKAITVLTKINGPTTQATDDTILAKSLLHLGRLSYKSGTFHVANNYLRKFYNKAKTANDSKELLDIARVNYGMIKGTEGMAEYIASIKNNDYDKFLKTKLEYKNSQQ